MTQKPAFKPEYREPTGPYIDRSEATEKLYRLEHERDEAFKAAAKELKEVLGLDHFWQEAAPEALLNMLEGWDHNAAQLAAKTYLEKQNNRAYTERDQQFVVLRCDVKRLGEGIKSIHAAIDSNQWMQLPFDQRESIVWLTNLLKVQTGG